MKSTASPTLIPGRRRGFTIIEVIMAMIIIGVLTLVLVPTLTSRGREAKINACGQELQHLCDAQERAAIDTGYLYRMYVLDDGPFGDTLVAARKDYDQFPDERDVIEGVRDNSKDYESKNAYKNPDQIFIAAKRTGDKQVFMDATIQTELFKRLTGGDNHAWNGETSFNWNGPYIHWHRDANLNDWPDDPWGNDYLFFTTDGVLYPPRAITMNAASELKEDHSYEFGDYVIPAGTSGGTIKTFPAGRIFGRPTILSMGPNGVPGNGNPDDKDNDGFGKGDDIYREFGGN